MWTRVKGAGRALRDPWNGLAQGASERSSLDSVERRRGRKYGRWFRSSEGEPAASLTYGRYTKQTARPKTTFNTLPGVSPQLVKLASSQPPAHCCHHFVMKRRTTTMETWTALIYNSISDISGWNSLGSREIRRLIMNRRSLAGAGRLNIRPTSHEATVVPAHC
jgi:hypothetical protein